MRTILLILLIFSTYSSLSQSYTDYLFVKSFNNSLLIQLDKKSFNANTYDAYGRAFSTSKKLRHNSSYLFQSQENDSDLFLIYFPHRVYNPQRLRFHTPDPLFQYFSPYLFVNSDPVNIIDFNGKEGVPLIIYGNDYFEGREIDYMTEDILNLKTNAHKISFNDFLDGNFGNVPKLNDNFFLIGHTGDIPDQEVAAARYLKRPKLLPKEGGLTVHRIEGKYETRMSGRRFGELLRKFASDHNTDVKNVMVASCKGTHAAKTIGQGIESATKKGAATRTFNTFGLKANEISATMGNVNATAKYGKFHIQPFSTEYHIVSSESEVMQIQLKHPKFRNPKYRTVNYFKQGSTVPLDKVVASEKELTQMITQARLAKQLIPHFDFETFLIKNIVLFQF